MASPATNKRMPDTKMSAGSRETCSANAGNEPMCSNMLAAIATRVGPIRPAIVFEVVIYAPLRMRHRAYDKPGSVPLELRESDGHNLFHRHSAVGELLGQNELLRIGQAGRYHHFPTRFQLVDQRRWNEIGGGRHDHLVNGGVLSPTP